MHDLEEILGPMFFFLAVFGIIAVVMWRRIAVERERQTTVRLAIERGQQLDAALVEKLLAPANPPKPTNPTLVPVGLLSAGVGLCVFGLFLRQIEEDAFWVMTGVGCMVAIIGLGVLLAVRYGRRLNGSHG